MRPRLLLGYPRALSWAPFCSWPLSTTFPQPWIPKLNCLQTTVCCFAKLTAYTTQTCYRRTSRRLKNGSLTGRCPFTPRKCTTIRVTRKKWPLNTTYQLHGHTLEVVDGGKYLGIYISNDLSWREHVRHTTAKATKSLGFLRRNLHSCPQNVRAQAYTTLIRQVLEYASTVLTLTRSS